MLPTRYLLRRSIRSRVLATFGNWVRIARHPTFRAYALLATASYGGLFTYLAASSFVFIQVLGLSKTQYGLVMFTMSLSYIGGTVLCRRLLARLGVRFSIDDFGTGYSSLAYLQRLPLYELKIDRGFVRDAPRQAGDAAITRLIISMAKHLGLKVVAEGVETPEQSRFLADNGCDVMQGFLYARPIPLDEWMARTCAQASEHRG